VSWLQAFKKFYQSAALLLAQVIVVIADAHGLSVMKQYCFMYAMCPAIMQQIILATLRISG